MILPVKVFIEIRTYFLVSFCCGCDGRRVAVAVGRGRSSDLLAWDTVVCWSGLQGFRASGMTEDRVRKLASNWVSGRH